MEPKKAKFFQKYKIVNYPSLDHGAVVIMSSVVGQKELLYEEEMSFTPEFNKTNYNESIIKYIALKKKC